jgi:hypothetical protein
MKYFDKYKFYIREDKDGAPKEVIAVSTYAGKYVRGVAKTNPLDEFDYKTGKELAAARCNLKVAEKRLKRSSTKLREAEQQLIEAKRFAEKMRHYYEDSVNELAEASNYVADLEGELE